MAAHQEKERRELTEDERDEMIKAKAEKLDAEIGKALGDMAQRQIEAAADVVAKRLGKQGMRYLFEEYGHNVGFDFDIYGKPPF